MVAGDTPLFSRIDREAILIGNAAAAQGAPVTTIGIDLLIRKSLSNVTWLKRIETALNLVIYKPVYPASQRYRLMRDRDSLQWDFYFGLPNYKSLRDRTRPPERRTNFLRRRIGIASSAL